MFSLSSSLYFLNNPELLQAFFLNLIDPHKIIFSTFFFHYSSKNQSPNLLLFLILSCSKAFGALIENYGAFLSSLNYSSMLILLNNKYKDHLHTIPRLWWNLKKENNVISIFQIYFRTITLIQCKRQFSRPMICRPKLVSSCNANGLTTSIVLYSILCPLVTYALRFFFSWKWPMFLVFDTLFVVWY